MEITRIPLAITVTCKCGGCVAATMLWGGIDINEEFTDTIAKVYKRGGKIELVNTELHKIQMGECTCKKLNA